MSIVSRSRPGGPPVRADGKRVRITIGNGSRVVEIHGELVIESTNWIICSGTQAIEFIIQKAARRTNSRVGRQYRTCCRLTTSTSIYSNLGTRLKKIQHYIHLKNVGEDLRIYA